MSVEKILHNANIATNATPSFVEAVAISDGKIIATGTDEEIRKLWAVEPWLRLFRILEEI